jgi:hypothetical protein
MALLRRLLHRHRIGDDADCWYLLFDSETKRLCVLHEWGNADDLRDGTAGERVELDVAAYLTTRDDAGQRELVRLVTVLFENGRKSAGQGASERVMDLPK